MNTMLIIVITIIMSKIQFLLHIHKKDLFLLPTPTAKSPKFYTLASHLSPIILVFCGILGKVSYLITE